MKLITQNIGVVAAVVMILGAVLVYNTLFRSEGIFIPVATQSDHIKNEALDTLSKLQNVALDQTLLSSPGYLLLSDFSATVTVQAKGRPNPFNLICR
jgi:hypothetical protein